MAWNEAARAAGVDALKAHWADLAQTQSMREAFAQDPQRFARFSLKFDDLLLDWSKCRIDDTTMTLLQNLAAVCDVEAQRDAMFAGEPINTTENRAVLHVALRANADDVFMTGGENVVPEVQDVLGRMSTYSEAIRSGELGGATGATITDVVNIGIGGSDLGPVMANLALTPYHDGPNTHFVSNIDPSHIADTLRDLDPASTLIIIASKTFTTIETMTNALAARQWLADALGEEAVSTHFVAVSTALDKVAAFGIQPERIFGFWDWVGGRYSVWSSIGLPVMLAIGAEKFREFLAGAHAMDEHFRSAPFAQNLPIMLGVIGYWHREICGFNSRAIIPYDQHLARLPAYLQQLDMESNGKSVKRDGSPVTGVTGPVVWGEPGTNGQHAFFQLLHQGTDTIPLEFMIAVHTHEPELLEQHQMLLANCFAQSEALMKGRTLAEAQAQLRARKLPEADVQRIAPHRVFSGNRPSITIVHDKLTPFALGRLIALYEHRVFVEAQLFGINAFDQWGVELGKELATELLDVVTGKQSADNKDASTRGLIAHLHQSGPV
ncbi:glucose-6-phosphate isomerase [Pseudochrobactrum sp. MP213Fo]|uniref:glucose-6-phosphate isomerase n=1 Tax=Pseudochrobactrum sp. MP213Fo TaxID=3022250 RepID=UPI003BA15198